MDQSTLHKTRAIFSSADTYEKIKRFLDFEHGNRLKILDVGSGSGKVDEYLRGFGHTVIELDVREDPSRANYITCDINLAWPVEDKNFDLVICTDVPEHLYDSAHILKESSRVLTSGGKLIFGVPNHFDLRQRLRMLFGKGIVHWDQKERFQEKAWNYSHIRFFNLAELKEFFAEYGWNAEKMQLNFMGGGIVPGRATPKFIKIFLLKCRPNLFSGKFIFLLSKLPRLKPAETFYIASTPSGF